jgi:hypothetical protein
VIRARANEQGLTLVELVITLAITGIVVVAVGGMLSTVFLSSTAVAVRMSYSHEVQNTAAYFSEDVQSIGVRNWSDDTRPLLQSVEVNAAYNSGLYPCGPTGTPDALVRMAWNDFDTATPGTPKLDVVSYVVRPTGTAGVSQLQRLLCQNGSVVSDRTVIRELGTGAAVACAPSSCTASTPPTSVTMSITVHGQQTQDPDVAVTLQGHRRHT